MAILPADDRVEDVVKRSKDEAAHDNDEPNTLSAGMAGTQTASATLATFFLPDLPPLGLRGAGIIQLLSHSGRSKDNIIFDDNHPLSLAYRESMIKFCALTKILLSHPPIKTLRWHRELSGYWPVGGLSCLSDKVVTRHQVAISNCQACLSTMFQLLHARPDIIASVDMTMPEIQHVVDGDGDGDGDDSD